MELTDAQALAYIKTPYAKQEIDDLRKSCKELCAFVTGKNAKQYMTDLPYYERDELKAERLKMMLSAQDVIASTLSPRTRIFSAKGGSENFIIEDQNKEKDFRVYIDNITQGLSLKKWIQKFAIRRNDYDPNGIILIEQNPNGRVYPCFKSIMDIHDRQLNGRTPEYLIIKLCKKEIDKLKKDKVLAQNVNSSSTEIYRVIDDTTDRLFYKDKIVPNSTRKLFSAPKFPGIVSSNIPSDEDGIFYSPLNDCIERLRQYILHSSLYNLVFARQAFPKEYMQRIDCPNCQGTGFIDSQPCPECKGEGIMLSQKPADYIIIDWSHEDNKNVPQVPMGRNEAPVETLDFFASAVEQLKDLIYYIYWGMYKSDKISSFRAGVTRDTIGSNIEPTAYQAMLNAQPMITKLVDCSEWYIEVYRFIVNIIGKNKLGDAYKGCSILAGDRFMIESPDATWDRYLKAVTAQAPSSELDSILTEYIENKYANNPSDYTKYMLLLGVEPFIHYKWEQIQNADIPYIQKMEKFYFSAWKNSLTNWEFTVIANNLIPSELDIETIEEADDQQDDDVEPETQVGKSAIQNLKDNLRKFVLERLKDDGGLPKPFVTNTGVALPTNSEIKLIESPSGAAKPDAVGAGSGDTK